MSVKNILSIIPYPLFPTNNAGRKSILNFNNSLSTYLNTHAINVNYSTLPQTSFNLIPLFSNSFLRYFNIFYLFKIKTIITEKKIDFLLFDHPYMAWMGFFLNKMTGIQWGIRAHNIEFLRFKDLKKWWWWILKKYELLCFKKANAVFFVTEDDQTLAAKFVSIKNSFIMPSTSLFIQELPADNQACNTELKRLHSISNDTYILFYNGALAYQPNQEALDVLLEIINPLFLKQKDFKYKLIICGNGLAKKYKNLEAYKNQNIIYCGFVEDITLYFKGVDVYLNPVIGGGGIKTRLVESIAYNTNVISTLNGSIGFRTDLAPKKLVIVEDYNWEKFAQEIIAITHSKKTNTPVAFYNYYAINHIISRFIKQINSLA